jgi:hypothetical protein
MSTCILVAGDHFILPSGRPPRKPRGSPLPRIPRFLHGEPLINPIKIEKAQTGADRLMRNRYISSWIFRG